MEERLQKILSSAGVCSRRKAEELLTAGRVTVNGVTANLGDRADPEHDRVQVDGADIGGASARTYIMLHKPRGYVTTLSDEKGRKTVAELVKDCPARVWPVGRLDMDSEGLLLLTDDGDFTYRLTHPSHEVEKEYHVLVAGDISRAIPKLRAPMVLDGEHMAADLVERLDGRWLKVVIHQGRNRQVRRMCDAAGLKVIRLKRVREGQVKMGNLQLGKWRVLTNEEISLLQM